MFRKALFLALALLAGPAAVAAETPTFLDQGWSARDRQVFYTTTQGSRIMPLAWFQALERADSAEGFTADGLARHGYLANPVSPANPLGLPVGFTVDPGDGRWIGMTCAACHTGQVEYRGKVLRVDGAPTLAAFFDLLTDVRDALSATVAARDGAKFQRFAAKVLGRDATPARADALFDEVGAFTADWRTYIENSTTPVPWGRGRLDAFGMIFNRVSAIDLGVPENNAPPDAPVSYPFLWGSSWHDKVQWNGSAKNERIIDRLGRNVGEVLGVFGQAKLEPPFPPFRTYETSINRPNLLRLELLLRRLDSPAWPQRVLGAIDRDKAAAGREIFAKRCEGCHTVVPQGEQDTPVTVTMTSIDSRGLRTDPTMASNACNRTASTGRLAGARLGRIIEKLRQRLPARTKTLKLVAHVVGGAILSRPSAGDLLELARVAREKAEAEDSQLIEKLADSLSSRLSDRGEAAEQVAAFLADREATDEADCGPRSPLMRYKSRPLDGIWATAPYLHNGSVANLYEILLPPEERMESFHVGSRRYDPERVGYTTEPSPESTLFDTSLPGNSRLGHDYGNAKLSDEQRWQLVEYMKTL